MPFTLSHPAAVLPLVRRPFNAVALVAGSVASDMAYFVAAVGIPLSAQSWYEPFLNATTTHSPAGAVTVDLVYGLALCGLVFAARRPFGVLLPDGPASPRLGALAVRAWWVLASLLIGIATHLLWDSFTHAGGDAISHLSFTESTAAGGLTWGELLQYVSTAGGLAAIGWYLWRRRSRWATQDPAIRRHRRLLTVGLAVAVLLGAALGAVGVLTDDLGDLTTAEVVRHVVYAAAKAAGAAFVAAVVLYVAGWWVRRGVRASARLG
ncbi:DUF4184 family protein [Streptomyces sp. ID05-26A]|nr:DUF4184 family protein [Streptomyces sp. ID05-26A]